MSSQVKIYKQGNVSKFSSYALAPQNPGCESVDFYLAIAALQIDCWVEWVNSEANLADWPSRPARERSRLYEARPVFKQVAMLFPSQADITNPVNIFKRLRDE